MDILSARKKAKEARTKKKANTEQPPAIPEESQSHPCEAQAWPKPDIAAQPEPAHPAQEDGSVFAKPEQEAVGSAELDMLAFRLGPELYAMPIEQVREVTRLWEITPVPNSAPYILGIISLRGSVLPVIDLCIRLGIPSGERGEKSRIVVVNAAGEATGIVVDQMVGVVRIQEEEIRPAPETIEQAAGKEYIKGIARRGESLYIILDLDKAAGM